MNAILKLADVEKFKDLFDGNAKVHYTLSADGQYITVEKGITVADIQRHLSGEPPSLLSIPILPDDGNGNFLCHFAAIDVDRHDEADPPVDYVALARRVTELSLPLVVCKSKSPKSAHLWLFLKEKDGFSAATVRRLLAHYTKILGITGEVERFPKSDSLKEGQIGNGINLSFYGDQRIAFGRDGEELDADGFVALALERRVFGQILESRDLVGAPEAEATGSKEDRPLPLEVIRDLHAKNIESLRTSKKGTRNDTLNSVCFFASRAYAAGALEGTEDEIKDAIRESARACGMHDGEIGVTGNSGWSSGIDKPLTILEDEFPERASTLKEFNEQYYVVANLGGKCRVCWEEIDETTGVLTLGHQSFEDFRNAYMHEQILTGEAEKTSGRGKSKVTVTEPEYKSKANFWLDNPERQQYKKVVYAPDETLGPKIRNLWRGFAVEPVKGDCGLYLAHVHDNICKGDKLKFKHLTSWMAWKARHPGLKSYTCPVLKGPEGIGKNMCADPFAFLWGCHAFAVTKKEHVVGHFNAHLRACSVLIANEAFFAGDKAQESTLKSLITDEYYMLEPKGIDPTPARNRVSLIIISNENWVVPAGPTARRFSVFDCGDAHIEDFSYFNAIQQQLDGGRNRDMSGYKALLWYLLNEVDLGDFEPHRIIRTDALAEQQSQSLRGPDALWYECLYRGELPGALEGNRLQSERLLKWGQLQKQRKFDGITAEQVSHVLGDNTVGVYRGMGFAHAEPRPIVNKSRVRAWVIPSLRVARTEWDIKRFKVSWPDVQPLVAATAGKPSYDPDDWVIVPIGDEERTMRHDVVVASGALEAAAAVAVEAATAAAAGLPAPAVSDADERIPF